MRCLPTVLVAMSGLIGCANATKPAPATAVAPGDEVQLVLSPMGQGTKRFAILLFVDSVGNIKTSNGVYLEGKELRRVLVEWFAEQRRQGQPLAVHFSTADESKITLDVVGRAAWRIKMAVTEAIADVGGIAVLIRLDLRQLSSSRSMEDP